MRANTDIFFISSGLTAKRLRMLLRTHIVRIFILTLKIDALERFQRDQKSNSGKLCVWVRLNIDLHNTYYNVCFKTGEKVEELMREHMPNNSLTLQTIIIIIIINVHHGSFIRSVGKRSPCWIWKCHVNMSGRWQPLQRDSIYHYRLLLLCGQVAMRDVRVCIQYSFKMLKFFGMFVIVLRSLSTLHSRFRSAGARSKF